MNTTDTLELDAETLALFTDSVERYGREKYGFDRFRALSRSHPGFGLDAWSDYASMGWLAAALPPEDGGFSSHPVAIAALMRYAGEHLALEPLLANVVLCARLLAQCGGDDAARARLEALSSGERRFALAHTEQLAGATTCATIHRSGRISGHKRVVLHGDVADELIVSAIDDAPGEAGAMALFAVDVAQPGVRTNSYRLLDGRGAASFEFDDARATPLGPAGAGGNMLRVTLDDARLALCAEAHGAMRALNRQTLAYLKERRQFGRPIGSNQVLQHRMVELFMLEQEAAAVTAAAQRAWTQDANRRQRAIMGALAHVMAAGRQISHEAVQMHGGIGTTDELAVGHYFKRIMVINRLLGDRDAHVDGFACADAALAASGRQQP